MQKEEAEDEEDEEEIQRWKEAAQRGQQAKRNRLKD